MQVRLGIYTTSDIWKLHQPLGKCNVKEFSNITSNVYKSLMVRAFIRLVIYFVIEEITKAQALICTAVQIKKYLFQLACSQPITTRIFSAI